MKETGETELGVVGDKLLSEALTALRESVQKEGVSFFPTREMGGARGGVKIFFMCTLKDRGAKVKQALIISVVQLPQFEGKD